jgi:phosphoribosylformylglycinamidine synthase
VGAVEAVLECARNLACAGAEPLGLTNCLNFGNPEKPHIAWQLERAVAGLADACRALDVPVVGGNVSLYNEGGGGPIFPTPIVGMVGKLPDPDTVPGAAFRTDGHEIALLGPFEPSLDGSELARLQGRFGEGLPEIDLARHAAALAAVRAAVRGGSLASCHDVGDGGLAVCLAESCIAGGIGATVSLPGEDAERLLFGEGPGGVVVSGPAAALDALGGDVLRIGRVGGEALEVSVAAATLSVSVEAARSAYERGIPDHFS